MVILSVILVMVGPAMWALVLVFGMSVSYGSFFLFGFVAALVGVVLAIFACRLGEAIIILMIGLVSMLLSLAGHLLMHLFDGWHV